MEFQLLFVLILFQSSQASPLQETKSRRENSVGVKPKSYALNIQLFPEEETYAGEVVINIISLEKTNNVISLKAHKNVTIKDINVNLLKTGAGQKKVLNVQKTERNEETSSLTIVLETSLQLDVECEVLISFSGKINTHDTNGLFKKTYMDPDTNKTKWIIGSQLKPNHTQVVFPWFDNPSYKVPVDVSIQRPVKYNSLSTMPLLKSIDAGKGWVKDVFSTTPPMPVYALAIFVSDLKPYSLDKAESQIRIWPASEQNRKELVYKAYVAFQELFGVKYPLPKLDYISLPSSMGVKVSSSWGLVISGANIFDEEQGDIYTELSNQWAGNLITGSRSTPEDVIIDDDFPYFLSDYLRNLEKGDKKFQNYYLMSNLYAVYYELADSIPRDDQQIRRSVNIGKTNLIFNMLQSTLTDQTFTKALKIFIKQRQFKTFQWDDFWNALTEQAHADKTLPANLSVKQIATEWLNNYRLPYITATRNYDTNSVLLTQNLFIRKRPYGAVAEKDKHLLWKIPIVLQAQDTLNFKSTKPIHWMQTQEHNLQSIADPKQFIILNPEEIAPYMVNYDNTNWNMLANFLQSSESRTKIPLITRAKLVHDALNLAYAGTLDFGTALNVTAYLRDETNYIPWRPFFNMVDHIGRHIGGTNASKKFEEFTSLLMRPLEKHFKTITNPDKQTKLFINEAHIILRQNGDKALYKDATIAYEKWMKNPNAGYKDVVRYLCPIFEYGTQAQWDLGIKTLRNLKDKPDIERYYLFKCMVGCTKDHAKIKKFLNMTLFEQNDDFTDDDFKYAAFMLTGNADGFMATFEYLRENWDALKIRLQDKPEVWKQFIHTATNLHRTQDGLNQVSEFYSKHRGEFGVAEESVLKSLNKIKEEVQWTNKNLPNLENWLDNYILKNSKQ